MVEQQQEATSGETTSKKKRVVQVSECPRSVATAALIVRGAVLAVTGAPGVGGVAVSLCQPTYIQDKKATCKFSVSLGKRLGDLCELDLPETASGVEALIDAIEATANRMIAENHTIACFRMTKQDIVNKLGDAALDASFKKTKPDQLLTVAWIENFVVAVPTATPAESTGSCLVSIQLDRTQCNVVAGKKARKADVTVKFVATEKEGGESANVLDAAPSFETESLKEAKIRCSEGLEVKRIIDIEVAAMEASDHAAREQQEAADAAQKEKDDEMVVNIEEVTGKIDYNKLVDKFGSTLIDDALMKQLGAQTVGTGRVDKLHRFLRRGMFFSHRDLNVLLHAVQTGTPMYLYTGRGPSSGSMHLGHLIPFLFTKWLQDAFDAPLVIQMTDDEKFIFKGVYEDETGDNLDYFAQLTIENARDIIACGFDKNKTFIFSDLDYVGRMYPNIVRIWKAVTTNAVSNIFGFDGTANIGKIAFPAVQAAPSFASSFPEVLQADRTSEHLCLIPCAIDQDPYFRMTRDIAHKLVTKEHKLSGKPALIHSKFFPPLQGATGKMSSSDTNSAIFLTDTADEIARKIKEHAFSGGQDTKAKQEELGADLKVDVSYQWLQFFLEDDDELAAIGESYGSGKGDFWSTSKVKARLIEVLQKLVAEHQERRARISDDEVREWMKERRIV
jgi:tryptophanyl-tRNA synthetase